MKTCLQLAWKNSGNKDTIYNKKNNKMNNGYEKHPKKDKSKVTVWLSIE